MFERLFYHVLFVWEILKVLRSSLICLYHSDVIIFYKLALLIMLASRLFHCLYVSIKCVHNHVHNHHYGDTIISSCWFIIITMIMVSLSIVPFIIFGLDLSLASSFCVSFATLRVKTSAAYRTASQFWYSFQTNLSTLNYRLYQSS